MVVREGQGLKWLTAAATGPQQAPGPHTQHLEPSQMHLPIAADKAQLHWVYWCTPMILALERLREEGPEFQASRSDS